MMRLQKTKLPLSLLCAALAMVCVAALAPAPAHATVTLSEKNSTVKIDPDSQAGVYSWVVDGVEQMFQQWFWYRIGDTAAEQSIDTIGTPTVSSASDYASITYTDGTISVNIKYTLSGGLVGSKASDLGEVISIDNLSASAIEMHFFQYCDFDLNGTLNNDGVVISGDKDSVTQTDGNGAWLTETSENPSATYAEANTYANTLAKLNDTDADNLNNTLSAGPGDVTWAFQWDVTIPSGGTFHLSKDKQLRIPIPPTALLLGTGLIGLAGLGYRRKRKS